jgi:hypothetical protein
MAVHVETVESEVALLAGDLPLSEAQLDKLVQLVATRLRRLERQEREWDDEREISTTAAPPLGVEQS